MQQIYLLRHGAVQEQYRGALNGWIDIPLSKSGAEQIAQVAKELGGIDTLYSSDLQRCKNSLPYFDAKEIIISQDLREKSFGVNEGKRFESLKRTFETFDEYMEIVGGESVEDFQNRVLRIWHEIKKREGRRVVLTHGGVIHLLLSHEKGISLEESFRQTINYGELLKLP